MLEEFQGTVPQQRILQLSLDAPALLNLWVQSLEERCVAAIRDYLLMKISLVKGAHDTVTDINAHWYSSRLRYFGWHWKGKEILRASLHWCVSRGGATGPRCQQKKKVGIPDNLQQGLPKRVSQRGRRSHVDFRTVGDRYVSGPPTSATRRPGWIGTGESYRNTYVQYIILSLLQHVLHGMDQLTDEGGMGVPTLPQRPLLPSCFCHD